MGSHNSHLILVFQGDVYIHLEGAHATRHDHARGGIGPLQRLPPARGGGKAAAQVVLLPHVVHRPAHYIQPPRIYAQQ
jgi:hypothetical protein